VKKSVEDGVTDLAASIAFYVFFGLFPLLLAVIAIAGHVLESAEAQTRVHDFLAESFPGSADLLRENITSIVEARGPMGLAALLGLLWSASAGFGAVSRGINRAMGTPPRRSMLKARIRYLLMALTVSALLVVYVTLTSAVELLKIDQAWSAWLGVRADSVTHVKTRIASLVLVFLILAALYRGAPTRETHWRDVWRGALLAALLTEVGKVAFLAYLDHVANLEAVFGSLSSIMVLLLWLYVSAIALILGAEFNAVRAAESASPAVSACREEG